MLLLTQHCEWVQSGSVTADDLLLRFRQQEMSNHNATRTIGDTNATPATITTPTPSDHDDGDAASSNNEGMDHHTAAAPCIIHSLYSKAFTAAVGRVAENDHADDTGNSKDAENQQLQPLLASSLASFKRKWTLDSLFSLHHTSVVTPPPPSAVPTNTLQRQEGGEENEYESEQPPQQQSHHRSSLKLSYPRTHDNNNKVSTNTLLTANSLSSSAPYNTNCTYRRNTSHQQPPNSQYTPESILRRCTADMFSNTRPQVSEWQ